MIVIEQVPEINNKPNKFIVFLLNDHYDVKIRPVVFGSIISIMAVITVLIPYIALLTVPTYLAILPVTNPFLEYKTILSAYKKICRNKYFVTTKHFF